MDSYEQNLQEEKAYLHKAVSFIRTEIEKEMETLSSRRGELLAIRKEMWENTVHFSTDFERLTEISQYLSVLKGQTTSYDTTFKQIKKYERMVNAPYFGRFDFVEDGSMEEEQIYVGLHNVIDSKSYDIIVYDWRAPVSSIFYNYELGKVAYQAPKAVITGVVLLKRQYKIHGGELEYFFDCSIKIDDEILQQVLGGNASPKMRNIVETIQKEQNIIIRDTDNELLIVQGSAGSGKTSIALHRIAFLLYQGLHLKLSSSNIIIISPNEIFSKYISGVLPELGEENVEQTTFEDVAMENLDHGLTIEKKNERLQFLINCKNYGLLQRRKRAMEVKGSMVFMEILNRLIQYYERNLIDFEDIYYDGKTIATKQQLKNQFLSDKIGRPMVKRLQRMESMVLDKIHPLRKNRIKKIENLVQKMDGHEFEIKSFSRLLSMKESGRLLKRIRNFTEIDYMKIYEVLFTEHGIFSKLAEGLDLPDGIEEMIQDTKEHLQRGSIQYEDCAPLLFIKLKIEGSSLFSQIRQVVIDEAQDYSPMEYGVFNLLFRESRFTILGDIHQSIDKDVNKVLYDTIEKILNKRKSIQLFLNKSYRSSYEISDFCQNILGIQQEYVGFERHEARPVLLHRDSKEGMESAIINHIKSFIDEGYTTIGIICKTGEEAKTLHDRLKKNVDIRRIDARDEIESGVMVIPAYMAKGLEFDAVIVYNVSEEEYTSSLDRKLLYIACTRALHRLVLCYTGNGSNLIPYSQ